MKRRLKEQASVHLRIEKDVKEEVEELAKEDHRTISDQFRYLLAKGLEISKEKVGQK